MILADLFQHMGIPYVYEAELTMKNGAKKYPDFLLLNKQTRKTYVPEHFGMMDKPEYAQNQVHKIREYEENGYWQGVNILYTFETSNIPLNIRSVEKMMKQFLL